MKRRDFLSWSTVAASCWAQSATPSTIEPETTLDLVDSSNYEIGEMTASQTHLWGLARKIRSRNSFEVICHDLKTKEKTQTPLPDGTYAHISVIGQDAIAVFGRGTGRGGPATRWDVRAGTSPVQRSERSLSQEVVATTYCGERLVAAMPDGSVWIDADRSGNEGKLTRYQVFTAHLPLGGYYPSRLLVSVVADTTSTVILVDHFLARVGTINLASGIRKEAIQISDPVVQGSLAGAKRYLDSVKDPKADVANQFREAVTPTVIAFVCGSEVGRVWIATSPRYPSKQLLLEIDQNGKVSRRIECVLPGGTTPRAKVPMFATSDGSRLYLGYWSGRVYAYALGT